MPNAFRKFFKSICKAINSDIFGLAISSFWVGASIFIFEEIKNILIATNEIDPSTLMGTAPLLNIKLSLPALWDIAIITTMLFHCFAVHSAYLLGKKAYNKHSAESE